MERPSDNMQPTTKRRAGDQKGKDDADDDDEEGEDPGSWQPDPDVIAKRRRVKVRRAGEAPSTESAQPSAAAAGVAAASSNPFQGISLLTTPAPVAASTNPFVGISLLPPAAAPESAASTPALAASDPTKVDAKTPAEVEAGCQAEGKETPKDDKEVVSTPGTGTGFGSYASANPFSALTGGKPTPGGFGGFGGFAASAAATPGTGGGFGGFRSAAEGISQAGSVAGSAAVTPMFGSTPKPSGFSFGTGAFPAITPPTKTATNGDEAGDVEDEAKSNEVFNSDAEFRPAVQLPEQNAVTGEEDESVAFTADSTLFEFDTGGNQWRERGKGEFRLNTNSAGQARMLMRQAGNLRLLLNANVFASMALQLLAGGGGLTFGCANFASAQDMTSPDKKDAPVDPAAPSTPAAPSKMSTWCLRIKNKEQVTRLLELLERQKRLIESSAAGGDADARGIIDEVF